MQEKSGAWPNGQTPLCLQSESAVPVWYGRFFDIYLGKGFLNK